MARPLFQLGPRLALCAELLQGGRPFCDVGTDHAYLPIWLLKSGKISQAVASDINPGPLKAAAENARRYQVEDSLSLRLSDGLQEIRSEEAEEIVIAGMGGELILRIVKETPWLMEKDRRLVLQPMSSAEELRRGLSELCMEVSEERAVLDGGRPYTAFSVSYIGKEPETGDLFPYLGKLSPGTEAAREYAARVCRDLAGRVEGARRGRRKESPEALLKIREKIREIYRLQ